MPNEAQAPEPLAPTRPLEQLTIISCGAMRIGSPNFYIEFTDYNGGRQTMIFNCKPDDNDREIKAEITRSLLKRIRKVPLDITKDMADLLTLIMEDAEMNNKYGDEWDTIKEEYEKEI